MKKIFALIAFLMLVSCDKQPKYIYTMEEIEYIIAEREKQKLKEFNDSLELEIEKDTVNYVPYGFYEDKKLGKSYICLDKECHEKKLFMYNVHNHSMPNDEFKYLIQKGICLIEVDGNLICLNDECCRKQYSEIVGLEKDIKYNFRKLELLDTDVKIIKGNPMTICYEIDENGKRIIKNCNAREIE